ncbi:hypothetical protein ASPWEDRAFT_103849 [Aspergillus wentii DTO 134E9]|uniref:Histone transcription regulator 3 homolog n=1 Tax=Aspergillus wentii DTO 134E9 TaxID=1073089 RepID=A0A1L9RX08_ASPWE|nr:uncharacterized protein ASPWEDRAFT_103849 [Aspergillus wentii DTO 134E9]OJJ39414.1 hypothetical protein ASPWEDRAFT_103849 [Aspergillus wentii DTO 134E9]
MSNWVALNIEPDEAVEEEVDDTKEIQIEEALKLYQNALKLHSQGPQFYPQAAEAYDALLNSEIFKYPESISDYKRSTLQDSEPQFTGIGDVAAAAATAVSAAETLGEFDINDSTSSTLLQTIYLSYKNHGQYLLDSLQAFLQSTGKTSDAAQDTSAKITECSSAALASFADALERDDTDLNLWRQSARLSSTLQSYRLVRYCLESVLADDENRLEVRAEQLGLEETFAEDRLRDALQSIYDRLSVSQVPLKKPKKALLKFLRQQTDPYPYLPALPENLENADSTKNPLALHTAPHVIKAADPTWLGVGKAIVQTLVDEEKSAVNIAPGASINLLLPASSPELAATTTTTQGDHKHGESSKAQDDKNQSLEQKDGNVPEEEKPSSAAHPPHVTINSQELDSTIIPDDQSSIDRGAEKQLMESLEVQSAQLPEAVNEHETANGDDLDSKSSLVGCRKRSSASAANDENTEGMRAKSRRTRARDSNVENLVQTDEIAFDQTKYYEDRLEVYVNADEWLFGTVGSLLSKVGVQELGTIDELKTTYPIKDRKNSTESTASSSTSTEAVLFQDLRNAVSSWDEGKAQAMLQGDNFSTLQDLRGMSKSGLAIFLEHSKKSTRKLGIDKTLSGGEELFMLQKSVNDGWFHMHEVVFAWLRGLLMSEYGKHFMDGVALDETSWPVTKSTYVTLQWPDALKETVVQVLLREDEHIYNQMCEQVTSLERRVLSHDPDSSFEYTLCDYSGLEMIQAIFELHLDVYALINNPNSEIDRATRVLQWDRLERWSMLARTSLNHFIDHGPAAGCQNNLALRHLWASTFHSNMAADVQREHILLCLQDLKHVLSRLDNPAVTLINNAIMPELSAGAIDQEISKLKSMDFFLKIFSPESKDPVDLIETIEPILEPSSVEYIEEPSTEHASTRSESQVHEMGSFLDQGDATLRLFLWRRLLDAYKAIDYQPKVVSCYLRIIEAIVKELWSASHLEETAEHRQAAMLRWLKSVDGILSKVVPLVLSESDKAYDCFDLDHLKSSMSAVALLSKLLHSFALFEDSIRVGQIPGPELRILMARSLESFKEKLRDAQVRCWILQFTLFREAISQNRELFDTPLEDRIQYLRSVHNALGVRSMCRRSQRQFLKLMKSELLDLEDKEDYEPDICQVLYDLHGIKLAPAGGLAEHGTWAEKLDRPTAVMMIDLIMCQAKKLSIKDLSKSELKSTVDRMQHAIGTTKSSPPLSFNKRIISTYLKSPINPSNLVRAVRGVEDLPLIPLPTENAEIAQKGWYFLLGHASLTKFRSQKRLNPLPTTDLDEAITYFRQDLEHGTGRWESWYRLAQTYDSKLEEDITWNADKINNNRTELVVWQRNAIHCYAMAVSTAIRTAEPTLETRELMSDLYTDFGNRLYTSSREPFSMGAFSLVDFARHYSNEESQEMYKGQPFREMKLYSVWSFASHLLKRAIVDKPKNWMNHYMLCKCLWKMFSCDESVRGSAKRISIDDVLDALLDSIDTLPQRKDSRSDPIFEPHYKLVSIIHKLVHRDTLTPAEGSKTLLATPWARKVQPPEDKAGWQSYILEVLRKLKNGDKSNWHHRMASRAAHIIYDDKKDASVAATAKNELTQQIFTKTMTIQVWKPEYERPGRHFVYTTRYVYFFVGLLDQLDDRANLDQLLRRVRKKQGDFINHTKLWEDICLTYAKVIRRAGSITEGHEESVFRPLGWEEFVANTARLENLPELAPQSSTLLELLREAVELKKLNNNLMKVALLEDLIADLYSRLYEINAPQLMEVANEENKEKMKVDHLLMANDGAADTAITPPTSAPPSEAPAPRGRTKGIARRDIQKRAETIVTRKLTVRALTTKTTAPADGEPSQPSTTAVTSAPHPAKENLLRGGVEDPTSGQQSDIPNSLHDSADDESELSEIDDEKLSKLAAERKALMFPNLNGSPGSGMSAAASADGEGGDEAEGEGQGDEDREGEIDVGEGEGETVMEDEGEEGEGEEGDMEVEEGDEIDDEGEHEGHGEEGDEEGEGEVEMEDFKEGEETEQPEANGTAQESEIVGDPDPMET